MHPSFQPTNEPSAQPLTSSPSAKVTTTSPAEVAGRASTTANQIFEGPNGAYIIAAIIIGCLLCCLLFLCCCVYYRRNEYLKTALFGKNVNWEISSWMQSKSGGIILMKRESELCMNHIGNEANDIIPSSSDSVVSNSNSSSKKIIGLDQDRPSDVVVDPFRSTFSNGQMSRGYVTESRTV
jgi:hypothetical protein